MTRGVTSTNSSGNTLRIINRARTASVARVFARLNTLPYDDESHNINKNDNVVVVGGGGGHLNREFNPSGHTYQASVMHVVREVFLVLLQQQVCNLRPTDHVAHKVPLYGATTCAVIAHNMEENYMQDRSCLSW
jgi:hypothetical protein